MDSGSETHELNGQAEGAEPAVVERLPGFFYHWGGPAHLTDRRVSTLARSVRPILQRICSYEYREELVLKTAVVVLTAFVSMLLAVAFNLLPESKRSMSQWFQRNGRMNINHYANKKSAAESMLDIALLMANASQLKAVMEQGPSFSFYVPLIVLISLSLTLQVMVGVLLIFLVKYDLNNPAKHGKLDFLNNLATGLVFIIVVVNIFITAFGVQKPIAESASRQ